MFSGQNFIVLQRDALPRFIQSGILAGSERKVGRAMNACACEMFNMTALFTKGANKLNVLVG